MLNSGNKYATKCYYSQSIKFPISLEKMQLLQLNVL